MNDATPEPSPRAACSHTLEQAGQGERGNLQRIGPMAPVSDRGLARWSAIWTPRTLAPGPRVRGAVRGQQSWPGVERAASNDTGRPAQAHPRQGRYRYVTLTKNGKQRRFQVHQLILAAFVGPCPEGMESNRTGTPATTDGLPVTRSRPRRPGGTLIYGTHRENIWDKKRHGTEWQSNITHCPQDHEYRPRTRSSSTAAGSADMSGTGDARRITQEGGR